MTWGSENCAAIPRGGVPILFVNLRLVLSVDCCVGFWGCVGHGGVAASGLRSGFWVPCSRRLLVRGVWVGLLGRILCW